MLAERERIAGLLADAGPDLVYAPTDDPYVQAKNAANAATAAREEAAAREALARPTCGRTPRVRLARLNIRSGSGPEEGDETVRQEPTWHAGGYQPQHVDAWLAPSLAAHHGHLLPDSRLRPCRRAPPAAHAAHAELRFGGARRWCLYRGRRRRARSVRDYPCWAWPQGPERLKNLSCWGRSVWVAARHRRTLAVTCMYRQNSD